MIYIKHDQILNYFSKLADKGIRLPEELTDKRDTIRTNAAVISPKRTARNLSPSESNKDNFNEESFRRNTQIISNNKMSLGASNNQRLTFKRIRDENRGIHNFCFLLFAKI